MFHVCCDKAVAGVASSAAGPQSAGGYLRLPISCPNVHAARLPASKRTFGTAARTNAVSTGSRGVGVDEEVVDAIAVLERPGAVPNTQFEQHDHALHLCEQLQAFNLQLGSAIDSADTVLEQSEWDTLTLPPEVNSKFIGIYRDSRKEQHRHEKEERRQRREERFKQKEARKADQQQQQQVAQASTPAAPLVQQPPAAPSLPQQGLPQQHQAAAALSALPSAAAPNRQRRGAAQQPLVQTMPQQPLPRARRQRSSGAAIGPVVPAAISNSISSPSSSGRISSSSSEGSSTQSPVAVAATPVPTATSAAAAAPVPRSKATTARAGRTATRTSATASPSSSSSSSSSSALAAAAPGVQQPAAGFAPLPVLQQRSLVTPVVRSASGAASSRRLHRAAGMGRRSSSTAAAAVGAAPPQALKLSDNTLHGLDLRAELLTADQEKELAVMVQDLLALEGTAQDLVVQLGRPPSDMEWMEAAGAAGTTGDVQLALNSFHARLAAGRQAKQVMIKANYKLVVSICRRYHQAVGMSMGDLINEGIAGLVKGVERFEPAKGFKFSTYAHWWIRQGISRSLADQSRLVRLPIHMQELLQKASKASKAFEAKHGREATAEELAPELGIDPQRLKDAWEAVTTPRSLDQPMGGEADGGTLGDVMEDERTIGSEEAVYIESLKQDLEGVLAGLSARDAGVLRMRFGLMDGKEYTLDEVGAQFKVTRERIRQIEAKAIRQLRAHHISPGSVMADYQLGPMTDKHLASRTSSGTKKQK